MTARTWTLDIRPPAPFLGANTRKDRRGDGDRRLWRAASYTAARQAKLPTGLARVRIDVVIAPPNRQMDEQNLRPTTKVIVDGLGPPFVRRPSGKSRGAAAPGYGLIPNDSRKHLDGEHLHLAEPVKPLGHVTVYVTDLTNVPPGRTWRPDLEMDGRTLVRVKRACNGCGEPIGDVTDEEIAAAFACTPMPDVRAECRTCVPQLWDALNKPQRRGGADRA